MTQDNYGGGPGPDEKQKPVGRAFALIEMKDSTVWVELGPVWRNRDQSLALTMHSEPLAWDNKRQPRKVQIRLFEHDQGDDQGQGY